MVVQRIWRIGRAMVIGVPQETGVRQHQGRITLIPKGAVVAEPNLPNLLREADRKEWHRSSATFEAVTKVPTQSQ